MAADAQRLGAQALTADDLDRSLLLARQGVALDDSLQTRGNLLAALLKSPAAIGVVRGDGDALIDLDLSPDGRTLAFMENDGTLRFVDTRTRRAAAPPVASARPRRAASSTRSSRFDQLHYSPDGSRIAVGALRSRSILDATTHRVLAHLQIGSDRYDRSSPACASRPTGARSTPSVAFPAGRGALVLRLDGRTGRRLSGECATHRDGFASIMPTRDGRALVTANSAERETVIRDARTLRVLRRVPVGDAAHRAEPRRPHAAARRRRWIRALRRPADREGPRRLRPPRRRRRARHLQRRRSLRHHRRARMTASSSGTSATRRQGEVLSGHHGRITALAVSRRRHDALQQRAGRPGPDLGPVGHAAGSAARSRSASTASATCRATR